jgi:G3E family GTPase
MKTKIFIITGFLGAGKTTLLKRILNASADLSKTVVLVNEFGKVGIDSALIKSTANANIVELSSGCICCSLKIDMIQTLQILRRDYSPERIVIEATGVADPISIIEAIDSSILAPHFCVEKTITVVDYEFWEAREVFGYVFKSQLEQADIILLNKIDTLDPSDILATLKEIKEESFGGIVIPTVHCNIDPDIFWSHSEQENLRETSNSHFHAYNPAKDFYSPLNEEGTLTSKEVGFISFSFKSTKPLDEDQFVEFLDNQPLEMFRIKGPVRFSNRTEMLNYVGGKSDWQKWPDTITTSLVFIGWGVIEEQILEQLTRCLIEG